MAAQTITVKLDDDGDMSVIPIAFDPKAVFGKVRAPVKVTLKGYTYRSTIFSMGGKVFIPLRRSHREAAGITGSETLKVRIEADTEKRAVTVPAPLQKLLDGNQRAATKWATLSYTAQREHAEAITGAKKPETLERRLEKIAAALKA